MLLLLLLYIASDVRCEIHNDFWTPAPHHINPNGYLQQVHIIFRHGHRVPLIRFPTDPNANAPLWDEGLGELTKLGRQQGYQLGQHLRQRYGLLLPDVRAWRKVHVMSSDINRTLMTAGVVLAGLLPPEEEDKWSEINWQPVPIHTQALETDNLLLDHLSCPKYQYEFKALKDNISGETLKIYDYISQHSGLEIKSLRSMADLYMCLEIENQVGLILPNWTRSVYPEFMKNETMRYFSKYYLTEDLRRLGSGPLLEQLITFDEEIPIKMYSTHDTVISGLLGAIGIKMNKLAGFLSVVAIEYRQDIKGRVMAELWWREGPNDTLEKLEWPGCGTKCPLSKLKDLLRALLSDNWYRECALSESKVTEDTTALINPLVCFTIFSFIIIISVFIRHRRSRYEWL